MDFELIWHAASPSVKFVLEPSTDSVDMIYMEIENHQEKYKNLCKTLKVTQLRGKNNNVETNKSFCKFLLFILK